MPSDMYLCAGTTNGMIGMFLGPGSGYHGHRKRQDSRQAHHDDDLPNHLPHLPHASKNIEVVCSSDKRQWAHQQRRASHGPTPSCGFVPAFGDAPQIL